MKTLGFYLACSEPQGWRVVIIISFAVIATLWGAQPVCPVLRVLWSQGSPFRINIYYAL